VRSLGLCVLLLGGLGMLAGARKAQAGTLAVSLLALLHLLDVQDMHSRYISFSDVGPLLAKPAALQLLPEPSLGEPYRVFARDAFANPNQLEYWGFENIDGYHALPMNNQRRLLDALGERTLDYANLMGVRYFLVPGPIQMPGIKALNGSSPFLYENLGVFPRARMLYKAQVADQREIFRRLRDEKADVSQQLFVEEDPGPLSGKGGPFQVQWVHRSPLSLDLEVQTAEAGLLLLSQSWYPLWEAKVDGREARLLRADGDLQAVRVEAGTHRVQFDYVDRRFQAGLGLAALGTLLLAYSAAWFWRQRRGAA
jgi:hypothetical protein